MLRDVDWRRDEFSVQRTSQRKERYNKKTKKSQKEIISKVYSARVRRPARRSESSMLPKRRKPKLDKRNANKKFEVFFFVFLTLPGGSCPIGTMWTNSSLSLFFPKYNDQKRSLILIRENRRKIIYRGASVDYSSIGDDFPAALVGLEDPREKKKRKINSSGNNFFFSSSTWSPVGLP